MLTLRAKVMTRVAMRAAVLRNKTRLAYPDGMKAYEDDYVAVAEYPPVDYETRHYTNNRKAFRQKHLDWQSSIGSKEIVEEKLMQLNDERAFGWKAYNLTDDFFTYDSLPFMKYITRTHSLPQASAPQVYSSAEILSKTKHYASLIHGPLEEVLKFEMYGVHRDRTEETPAEFSLTRNQAIANQVVRFLLQVLSADESLLNELQVDYRPKSEAFWFVGGFVPPPSKVRRLEKLRKEGKEDKNWLDHQSHTEEVFQYLGNPLVQLRSTTPLEIFFDDIDSEIQPSSEFKFRPGSQGCRRKLRFATNIPGHWSGDAAKGNFLSFHSAHFLNSATTEGVPLELDPVMQPAYYDRKPQLLEAQAILTSFARLLAQAYMLGFDQFGDITYPLTTQTVIFDGIDWSFSSYQLNTIQLDNFRIKKNLKSNYCWTIPTLKLFNENSHLNPAVVEMLLKFFLSPTVSKVKAFETPYVKYDLNKLPDDYRREFVLYNFHEMVSQRRYEHPNTSLPEIANWERIYKLNHATRPMDARKKFFMIPGDNPYKYKYNYKNPRYRPKRLHYLEGELAKQKQEKAIQAIKEAQQTSPFKIEDN